MLTLPPEAMKELCESLTAAFTLDELKALATFELEANLDHIVDTAKALSAVVLDLVRHYLRLGELERLLRAAAAARPNQSDLIGLCNRHAPHVLGPVRPAVNAPAQLPAGVADFTGREDVIRRLAEALRGDGGKVASLWGMGGVGKTSLAVRVAHEVKDRFPDGQLVLDLQGTSEGPMTAAEAMARIIRVFLPDRGPLPEAEAELLPIYRSTLAGKRALVLLDNATDEAQVQDLISAPPPVGFIVTGRPALALIGESVELGGLSEEEAVRLLRGIARSIEASDDEWRSVSELCGRLPLALRVAGDFLRLHPDCSVAEYVANLRTDQLRWLKAKVGLRATRWEDLDEQARRRLSVEPVLALSARQLVKEDRELARQWQTLSAFPGGFTVGYAAYLLFEKDDFQDSRRVLYALRERSLVMSDATQGRFRLHDLMRPIARKAFDYGGVQVDTAEC
jgi:hypothetical protein